MNPRKETVSAWNMLLSALTYRWRRWSHLAHMMLIVSICKIYEYVIKINIDKLVQEVPVHIIDHDLEER